MWGNQSWSDRWGPERDTPKYISEPTVARLIPTPPSHSRSPERPGIQATRSFTNGGLGHDWGYPITGKSVTNDIANSHKIKTSFHRDFLHLLVDQFGIDISGPTHEIILGLQHEGITNWQFFKAAMPEDFYEMQKPGRTPFESIPLSRSSIHSLVRLSTVVMNRIYAGIPHAKDIESYFSEPFVSSDYNIMYGRDTEKTPTRKTAKRRTPIRTRKSTMALDSKPKNPQMQATTKSTPMKQTRPKTETPKTKASTQPVYIDNQDPDNRHLTLPILPVTRDNMAYIDVLDPEDQPLTLPILPVRRVHGRHDIATKMTTSIRTKKRIIDTDPKSKHSKAQLALISNKDTTRNPKGITLASNTPKARAPDTKPRTTQAFKEAKDPTKKTPKRKIPKKFSPAKQPVTETPVPDSETTDTKPTNLTAKITSKTPKTKAPKKLTMTKRTREKTTETKPLITTQRKHTEKKPKVTNPTPQTPKAPTPLTPPIRSRKSNVALDARPTNERSMEPPSSTLHVLIPVTCNGLVPQHGETAPPSTRPTASPTPDTRTPKKPTTMKQTRPKTKPRKMQISDTTAPTTVHDHNNPKDPNYKFDTLARDGFSHQADHEQYFARAHGDITIHQARLANNRALAEGTPQALLATDKPVTHPLCDIAGTPTTFAADIPIPSTPALAPRPTSTKPDGKPTNDGGHSINDPLERNDCDNYIRPPHTPPSLTFSNTLHGDDGDDKVVCDVKSGSVNGIAVLPPSGRPPGSSRHLDLVDECRHTDNRFPSNNWNSRDNAYGPTSHPTGHLPVLADIPVLDSTLPVSSSHPPTPARTMDPLHHIRPPSSSTSDPRSTSNPTLAPRTTSTFSGSAHKHCEHSFRDIAPADQQYRSTQHGIDEFPMLSSALGSPRNGENQQGRLNAEACHGNIYHGETAQARKCLTGDMTSSDANGENSTGRLNTEATGNTIGKNANGALFNGHGNFHGETPQARNCLNGKAISDNGNSLKDPSERNDRDDYGPNIPSVPDSNFTKDEISRSTNGAIATVIIIVGYNFNIEAASVTNEEIRYGNPGSIDENSEGVKHIASVPDTQACGEHDIATIEDNSKSGVTDAIDAGKIGIASIDKETDPIRVLLQFVQNKTTSRSLGSSRSPENGETLRNCFATDTEDIKNVTECPSGSWNNMERTTKLQNSNTTSFDVSNGNDNTLRDPAAGICPTNATAAAFVNVECEERNDYISNIAAEEATGRFDAIDNYRGDGFAYSEYPGDNVVVYDTKLHFATAITRDPFGSPHDACQNNACGNHSIDDCNVHGYFHADISTQATRREPHSIVCQFVQEHTLLKQCTEDAYGNPCRVANLYQDNYYPNDYNFDSEAEETMGCFAPMDNEYYDTADANVHIVDTQDPDDRHLILPILPVTEITKSTSTSRTVKDRRLALPILPVMRAQDNLLKVFSRKQ